MLMYFLQKQINMDFLVEWPCLSHCAIFACPSFRLTLLNEFKRKVVRLLLLFLEAHFIISPQTAHNTEIGK
jgi:uncharacterized protein YuzB (UPF0349 family)